MLVSSPFWHGRQYVSAVWETYNAAVGPQVGF